jgi:hypothetical protein
MPPRSVYCNSGSSATANCRPSNYSMPLNSRIVIEQAKGIIARAHGVTVDEAFTMIRSYARSRRHRLVEVANDIVADPSNPPDLAQSQEVKRCRR